jgi:hypothetical protein
MVWAEAVLRGNGREIWPYPGKRGAGLRLDRSRVIRQVCREGTALSGLPVVVAQDPAEPFPAMHLTGPAPDLGARVDEAIAQALVIPLAVIMLQELTNGLAQ